MSQDNPAAALDALAPGSIQVGAHSVRPITLGVYALLDRFDSPLTRSDAPGDMLGSVVTFYIMTRDPVPLLDRLDFLRADALAWAETLHIADSKALTEACLEQLRRVNAVVPDAGPSSKKRGRATGG